MVKKIWLRIKISCNQWEGSAYTCGVVWDLGFVFSSFELVRAWSRLRVVVSSYKMQQQGHEVQAGPRKRPAYRVAGQAWWRSGACEAPRRSPYPSCRPSFPLLSPPHFAYVLPPSPGSSATLLARTLLSRLRFPLLYAEHNSATQISRQLLTLLLRPGSLHSLPVSSTRQPTSPCPSSNYKSVWQCSFPKTAPHLISPSLRKEPHSRQILSTWVWVCVEYIHIDPSYNSSGICFSSVFKLLLLLP